MCWGKRHIPVLKSHFPKKRKWAQRGSTVHTFSTAVNMLSEFSEHSSTMLSKCCCLSFDVMTFLLGAEDLGLSWLPREHYSYRMWTTLSELLILSWRKTQVSASLWRLPCGQVNQFLVRHSALCMNFEMQLSCWVFWKKIENGKSTMDRKFIRNDAWLKSFFFFCCMWESHKWE